MARPTVAFLLSEANPASARWSGDMTGRRNMLLLTSIRWLAVLGQLLTILAVYFGLGAQLPLAPMLLVLAGLVTLNGATVFALMRAWTVTNFELFLALLTDVVALTAQLYFSGGATNPFVTLYLLQVVLGAVLLDIWSSWALAGICAACFAVIALFHEPLMLPAPYESRISAVHVLGSWLNFVLAAVLLVLFVTRITQNLKERAAHLAEMRQRAAEEDHIVRMGLLASGAAHELGTPLASLAVILGDWKQMPALAADPRLVEEIAEMESEVRRCKDIVTGILYASGEVRGEAPERTSLRHFLRDVVDDWDSLHPRVLTFVDRLDADVDIVADKALAQIIDNVLDNGLEAGATHVRMEARQAGSELLLTIRDDGKGFPSEMLATIGKPYQSSKAREGAGLGLFLAVNVLRKLGGTVSVANGEGGGAVVTLAMPIAVLAVEERDA